MPAGFFEGSTVKRKEPPSLLPKCGVCGLYKQCKSPKMPVGGKGKQKILVISDAPTKGDDKVGQHFQGEQGDMLVKAFRKAGVDLRRDCHLTNSIICHPKGKLENRHIDACRPNIFRTINELKPHVIIPLGTSACDVLLSQLWKEDVGTSWRWAGRTMPNQKLNAWICPTYHPFEIRDFGKKLPTLERYFYQHIAEAVALAPRQPWDEVPDYQSEVETIHSDAEAAKILRQMIKLGGTIAFDYEATCLKPEYAGAQILCCSVCWQGKRTIAYPFYGDAVQATRDLLRSPLYKIASNLKFEDRWTRKHLKTRVRNWLWDTMVSAHVGDYREGVTSIKFQAFVRLGQESYDDHLRQFLKTKASGSKINRAAREIDLTQLLLYCGLDSLLEYKVAKLQMAEFGIPFPRRGK